MLHSTKTLRRLAHKRDDQGFTLIELMVVVLIIGVLVAIAVPLFLNAQGSARKNSAMANARSAQTVLAAALANGSSVGSVTVAALTNEGMNATATIPATLAPGVVYLAEVANSTSTICTADATNMYIVTFRSSGQVIRKIGANNLQATCTPAAPGQSDW